MSSNSAPFYNSLKHLGLSQNHAAAGEVGASFEGKTQQLFKKTQTSPSHGPIVCCRQEREVYLTHAREKLHRNKSDHCKIKGQTKLASPVKRKAKKALLSVGR